MLDKLKDLATTATGEFSKRLEQAQNPKVYRMMYETGLPDVKAQSMTLLFKQDSLVITYGSFIFLKKLILKPDDILEADINAQNIDQTANAIQGARIGKVLGDTFGEIGGAAAFAKKRREDNLHLVINYKGEPRTIFFQPHKNFQGVYFRLMELAKLRSTPLRNKIENKPQETIQQSNTDYTKQITDLHGLLEKGILTQVEFDNKKADILSKM